MAPKTAPAANNPINIAPPSPPCEDPIIMNIINMTIAHPQPLGILRPLSFKECIMDYKL